MTAEKLKLPLHDGGPEFEPRRRKVTPQKVQIVVGVCILVVLNVALFGFTLFYTLSRVKRLEYKVETLKNTLGEIKILDAAIAEALEQLDEDWNSVNETLQRAVEDEGPKVYLEEYDEDENTEYYVDDDDYDLGSYDQADLNETAEASEKREDTSTVKYAMDLTKLGKETSRQKRNVVAATQDGVLINSESYAEKRASYMTKKNSNGTPTPSTSGTTHGWGRRRYNFTTPYATVNRRKQLRRTSNSPTFRKSRVRNYTEDKSKAFRQVVRKSSLKSGPVFFNGDNSSNSGFTVVRDETRPRPRYLEVQRMEIRDENHPRVGRVKLPSVHYSGDTSRYIIGQHSNFNGNGHLRHPQRKFVDWKVSDWAVSAGMDTHFAMEEGDLTIKEPGIYFIYAQIYYLDRHDTTGFRVHKNSDTILQCTVSTHLPEGKNKGNTCYTAGIEYLSEGDIISLADITSGKYSVFEKGKSFFGVVKFSDIKIK